MRADPARESGKKRSLRALEATNFFLADVQTGVGPFLAAYLAGAGWNPGRVGVALTVGGVVTVALQTPAGAFVVPSTGTATTVGGDCRMKASRATCGPRASRTSHWVSV